MSSNLLLEKTCGVSVTLDRQKKGLFSTPIMREAKTSIARCTDQGKYETIADIDNTGTRVIVNPGGTYAGWFD
jgi:cyclohexadienyl dehydratase